MSFWEKANQALHYANQKCADKMERIENYKMRYESYDDESLIRKFKNSHGDERIACQLLLKERGYGNN